MMRLGRYFCTQRERWAYTGNGVFFLWLASFHDVVCAPFITNAEQYVAFNQVG
ncbi:MAG: hypothetical protein RL076_1236 [Chloroflexota bacterium]